MHYKIKDGHPYYLMWHEAAGNCGLSEVGPENNATQLKSKKASKPEDWVCIYIFAALDHQK